MCKWHACTLHCRVDKKHAKTCRITCCVKDALRSRQLGLCPTPFGDKQGGKDPGGENTGVRDMLAAVPGREVFSAFRSDPQ